jgi:hypothetical protein
MWWKYINIHVEQNYREQINRSRVGIRWSLTAEGCQPVVAANDRARMHRGHKTFNATGVACFITLGIIFSSALHSPLY